MLSLSHIIKQHAALPTFPVTLLDEHETPVDLTAATNIQFKMQLLGDPTVSKGGAVTVLDAEGGEVAYEFVSGDTQISGSYLATISATFPGGALYTFPFNDYWLISVEPDLSNDVDDPEIDLVFATVAQARAAGYELTENDLLRAQGHIEVMCGRMIEAIQEGIENETISRQDIKRLRMATIYQAVWVRGNPDVEERTDVTQIRTAGLSGESAQLTADGITLAPLARRLLIGLSWVRSRSIKTAKSRMTKPNLNRADGEGWGNL